MAPLYGAAALLTIGIVPWTLLAMDRTNRKLIAKAEDDGEGGAAIVVQDAEVEGLLKKWGVLNGARSLFPLAGSVVAMIAVLG